jgi:tetratricopeptide (TPR) repeat protein
MESIWFCQQRRSNVEQQAPKWVFKSYFRTRAFGWRASRLAVQRLNDATSEICANARRHAIDSAEGAVCLIERIGPTFELIDTSSGALAEAVNRSLTAIIPVVASALADQKRRRRWLERLWKAIQNDTANFMAPVQEHWGELCGAAEVASSWADKILPGLRAAWSDWRPGAYVKGTDLCLSSLLAGGRYQELLEVLALKQHPVWPWRRYGIRALTAQGLFDEALAYAEASRGLNIPNAAVDLECEAILLSAGRRKEAYASYALTANQTDIGLVTFQRISRKYPEIDRKQVLADLAGSNGDPGKWFAAAKSEGELAMALEFARKGRTEPRTLSRAARDFLISEPVFAFQVGRLAIEGVLAGNGYEITALDLLMACDNFMAAANRLGMIAEAKRELAEIVARYPKAPSLFRGVVSTRLNDGVPSVAISFEASPQPKSRPSAIRPPSDHSDEV